MSSPVSVCSERGVLLNFIPGTKHPADSINGTTTLKQFADARSKTPSYELIHLGRTGLTALHQAAKYGNISLIVHIFFTGGKNLLNLGDINYRTPLFCAIEYNQRAAARVLIFLGANVNMECFDYRLDGLHRKFDPAYKTPLSFAVEEYSRAFFTKLHSKEIVFQQKVAMAKLLLLRKAIMEPTVKTKEGFQIVRQAQKEIHEDERTLFTGVLGSTSLDIETVKTICSYVPLDKIPDNIPTIIDFASPTFRSWHSQFHALDH